MNLNELMQQLLSRPHRAGINFPVQSGSESPPPPAGLAAISDITHRPVDPDWLIQAQGRIEEICSVESQVYPQSRPIESEVTRVGPFCVCHETGRLGSRWLIHPVPGLPAEYRATITLTYDPTPVLNYDSTNPERDGFCTIDPPSIMLCINGPNGRTLTQGSDIKRSLLHAAIIRGLTDAFRVALPEGEDVPWARLLAEFDERHARDLAALQGEISHGADPA